MNVLMLAVCHRVGKEVAEQELPFRKTEAWYLLSQDDWTACFRHSRSVMDCPHCVAEDYTRSAA